MDEDDDIPAGYSVCGRCGEILPADQISGVNGLCSECEEDRQYEFEPEELLEILDATGEDFESISSDEAWDNLDSDDTDG